VADAFRTAIGGHTGTCAGGDVPVCLMLTALRMSSRSSYGAQLLTQALHSRIIGWQCGQGTGNTIIDMGFVYYSLESCSASDTPCVTPIHNRTWGAIQTLWR
jgi:hypothetical protein